MKPSLAFLALPTLAVLTACGGKPDTPAASNITAMTENRAEALEDAADMTTNKVTSDTLENRADAVRAVGDNAADKAEGASAARVENQAAATMNRM